MNCLDLSYMKMSSAATVIGALKVAYRANFDITKVTRASLLFQTDFSQTVVLIIILSVQLIRISVLIL